MNAIKCSADLLSTQRPSVSKFYQKGIPLENPWYIFGIQVPEMHIVLLPVLNEAETIHDFIISVREALTGIRSKLVVIDDGSTDGTLEKLVALENQSIIELIARKKEIAGCARGKALIDGLRYAMDKYPEAETFIEMDTDGAHSPEEIRKGLELLQAGNDVVIGSKYLEGSSVKGRGFARNLVSNINTLLLRLFVSQQITDFSNGFRLYNRKAANLAYRHAFRYQTPIYLGEVLTLWLIHGLSVGEFSSVYNERKRGISKVRWSDVWQGVEGVWFIYRKMRKG